MTQTPVGEAGDPHDRRRGWRILFAFIAMLVLIGGALWWADVAFPTSPTVSLVHNHPVDSAVGEPGDPNLPAKTVTVAMVERDGAMIFEPAAVEVAKGDQVRFKVTNTGTLDHEFVLSTLTDNLQHLEEMKMLPGMRHNGGNAVTLSPNAVGEVFWHFTRAGSFDFSCLIPGHREAGMHGSVTVK